jgi:hypothetical protein
VRLHSGLRLEDPAQDIFPKDNRLIITWPIWGSWAGEILTDQRGLPWTVDGNDKWKLQCEDLAVLETIMLVQLTRVKDLLIESTQ